MRRGDFSRRFLKKLLLIDQMSHAERTERRAERKEAGEDDSEEDEPVEIPSSAVSSFVHRAAGTRDPLESSRRLGLDQTAEELQK